MTTEEKKAKKSEYNRRYRQKQSKRAVRNTWLKYKYGITLEQYEKLFSDQGKACAICGTTKPKRSNKHQNWAVDHCHTSGDVRGILCHPCNLLLGNAGDSTAVLSKAIAHLNDRNDRRAAQGA